MRHPFTETSLWNGSSRIFRPPTQQSPLPHGWGLPLFCSRQFTLGRSSSWWAHRSCQQPHKQGRPPARRFPADSRDATLHSKPRLRHISYIPRMSVPAHLPGKLNKPVVHLKAPRTPLWRTAPRLSAGSRVEGRAPTNGKRWCPRWDRIFALRKMTLGCFVTVFLCADGIGKNPETNTDIRHKKAYETAWFRNGRSIS